MFPVPKHSNQQPLSEENRSFYSEHKVRQGKMEWQGEWERKEKKGENREIKENGKENKKK